METETKKNHWKTVAIIFIVLFTIETSWLCFATYSFLKDDKQMNDCYWNFCGEYPEATYDAGVCSCYDYDMMGEYVLATSKYYGSAADYAIGD